MGWEKRGNGLYYYRKRRKSGQVVSEYMGSGELAELAARLDTLARLERELEKEAWRQKQEEILEVARMGDEAQEVILDLTRGWLLAQGYHMHKGQWRWKPEH
jgi:hypothetical protein